MRITAEDYRETSLERANTARILHKAGRYAPAIYLAGIAVESLLRAYIIREGGEVDTLHDMDQLLRRPNLRGYVPHASIAEIDTWLGEVRSRWNNLYRWFSEQRLRTEYRRLKLNAGV